MFTFIELPPFRRYLDSVENSLELLREIQSVLTKDPKIGDVIQGTGGIRKMRHRGKGKSKSGGFRVTYLYRQEIEKIYLIVVIYAKNEKENLSQEEKRVLRQLVDALKGEER